MSPPTLHEKKRFLDICIADNRLKLLNLKNLDLQDVSLKNKPVDSMDTLQYKKTGWKKFTKHLVNNYDLDIPSDKNLTTLEIDNYIQAKIITSQMQ